MKIPIVEKDYFGGERYLLYSFVKVGNVPVPVDFILDTGTPTDVVVMEGELKKYRIPFTKYQKVKGKDGRMTLDGKLIELYDLGECPISFKDNKNEIVIIKH